jgi:hypothetical protein
MPVLDIGTRQHLSSPFMYKVKQYELTETSLLLEVIEQYPLATRVGELRT